MEIAQTSVNSICIGHNQILSIQCQQWGSGQKILNIYIYKPKWPKPKYLSILVPQDAYKFVAAMDEVIRQLPVQEPTHPDYESPPILATQIGDYKFELRQKDAEWHFDIRHVPMPRSKKHKEWEVYLQFSAFPWLRQQMATILGEYDGTQWIEEMPKITEWTTRGLKLAESSLRLGPSRQLYIQCYRDKTGQKTIEISTTIVRTGNRVYLPKILVPQEAYKFVRAMDGLIGQFPAEAPAIPEYKKSGKKSRRPILASQMGGCENGQEHHFKFSVVWHQKDCEWDLNIHSVHVQTSEKHKHKEQLVYFPLWALPQLRQLMVTVLVEHDGTERIDEMPTMPEWARKAAEQKPNVEQEQVTEKKADEHCPCCTKSSKCWRHMTTSSCLTNRRPIRHGKR